MYIKNRYAALVYRSSLVVLCALAVFGSTGLPVGGHAGDFFTSLQYYGVWAALAALLYYAAITAPALARYLAGGALPKASPASHIKGALVMGMLLELIVYSLFLAGTSFTHSPGAGVFSSLALHWLVPLMVVADYALFDAKGSFRFSGPFYWMAVPLLYFSFVVLAPLFNVTYFGGASYPYPFLNPDLSDWGQVLKTVFSFSCLFLFLGYVLFFIDKAAGRAARRKSDRTQLAAISAYSAPIALSRTLLLTVPDLPTLQHAPAADTATELDTDDMAPEPEAEADEHSAEPDAAGTQSSTEAAVDEAQDEDLPTSAPAAAQAPDECPAEQESPDNEGMRDAEEQDAEEPQAEESARDTAEETAAADASVLDIGSGADDAPEAADHPDDNSPEPVDSDQETAPLDKLDDSTEGLAEAAHQESA